MDDYGRNSGEDLRGLVFSNAGSLQRKLCWHVYSFGQLAKAVGPVKIPEV